ncbi:MAG TPA: hypothetical protein VK741_25555 [Acetobacteraceae bacterium]|nr:hypothetical protein [Acetobacteraceae bacterium]
MADAPQAAEPQPEPPRAAAPPKAAPKKGAPKPAAPRGSVPTVAASPTAGKPKTMRAAVAPDRTVVIGTPRMLNKNDPGTQQELGPGSLVELPVDEAIRLIKAGFLLDPTGRVEAPPIGAGPVYDNDLTTGVRAG